MKFTLSPNLRQRVAKSISMMALLGCLCLFATVNLKVLGQETPPMALAPGAPAGSYALSDFDSVNLFNGRLNVHLPLFGVLGRGGAKSGVNLTIDSPFPYRTGIYDDGNGTTYQYVEPGMTSDGLHFGSYGMRSETSGVGQQLCYPADYWQYYRWTKTVTRIYVIDPDGTEHELRDVETGGQPQDTPANFCPMGPSFPGPYRGHKFVSTDGSGMTLIFDGGVRDGLRVDSPFPEGGGASWLLLKDGRRLRFGDGTGLESDTDRNGNKTVWASPSHPALATDSLNREIVEELPANQEQCATLFGGSPRTCYGVVQKGFGGVPRKIWVSYDENLRPSGILLPNGQKYTFLYNEYGDLLRLDLPTGGSIEYDYEPGLETTTAYCTLYATPCMPGTYNGFVYNRVVARRVYKEGHVLESRQTFSKPGAGGVGTNVGYVDKKSYDATDHLLGMERHFFHGTAEESFSVTGVDYPGWRTGREYRTEVYDGNSNLLRSTDTTWGQRELVSWWTGDQDYAPQNDPRVATTVAHLENGASTTSGYTYDPTVPYNSLTDVYRYDYNGTLLRHIHTIYLKNQNGVDYTGSSLPNDQVVNPIHMRDFPVQVSVLDATREYSRTTYEYDNYNTDATHAALLPRANISGLDSAYSSTNYIRGNVTATTSDLIEAGVVVGSSSSYAQYDVAGNVVKKLDPRGFVTEIFYDDHFGAPDGEVDGNSVPVELSTPGQTSFAFVTKVKNAANHLVYSQFDYSTGKAVDSKDANGVIASAYFNDALDRPKRVINGVNQPAPVKRQSTFAYDDQARTITSTTDLLAYNDNLIKGESVYDGLGRTVETHKYETASQYVTVKIVPFVSLQDPDTGVWLAATQMSNPFRQSESVVWTTTFMDAVGRISKVRTPDTALLRTYYYGQQTLAVDPTGKELLSSTNALGELKDVWEIKAADADTVAVSFPGRAEVTAGYRSSYEYDAAGHLITVTQGTQEARVFTYDTLGRLTAARNPENGTVNYRYDASGNLIVKTDARSVSAHYSYDELNRPVRRWYNSSNSPSDTTHNVPSLSSVIGVSPEVNFWYDGQNLPSGAPPNFARGLSTGRLVALTYGTGSSAGDYYGYDGAGRAVVKVQQTGGVDYLTTASYNASSTITSGNYPSGHSVSYNYDNAGRSVSFGGTLGDGNARTYASSITYSALGGLSQEQFGTAIPIYNKLFYNVRGQLAEIREGTTPNDDGFERGAIINFYAGCWGMCSGEPMPDNNGNLKRQEHWVKDANGNVVAVNAQSFLYDALGRLTKAYEGSLSDPTWQQSYLYDRFGNRRLDTDATTGSLSPKAFEVQATKNRLLAPGDTNLAEVNRRMRYDDAGNLTTDLYTGQGARTFDAENRMTQAVGHGQMQNYTYDASGQRVRRNVDGTELVQVYGLGGELLAEYAINAGVPSLQKEYGYRNGQLLIVAGTGAATAAAPSTLTAAPSSGGGNVELSWAAAAGAVKYRLERKGATGSFVLAGVTPSTSLTDSGVAAGSAYLYRVCAANAQGSCTSAFSNIALGAAVSFPTDPNITSTAEDPTGVNATVIRAAHITELRTAVNAVRSLAGLPAAQWSAPNQTVTPNVSIVYAIDVLDLRLRLHEALQQLNIQTSDYEDQQLHGAPNGTNIRKVHITQLRQRSTSGTGGAGGTSPNLVGVQWLVADQLGSPRMVFDETGSLGNVKRHDYLPFGEALTAGARSTTPGYGIDDGVRQSFTGYERDTETELDYGQARYYSTGQGRYTGVDPIGGRPSDPQAWNRYAYVGNNPMNRTDPTGMNYFIGGGVNDPSIREFRVDGFELSPLGSASKLTLESLVGVYGQMPDHAQEIAADVAMGVAGMIIGAAVGNIISETLVGQGPPPVQEPDEVLADGFAGLYAQMPTSGTGYYRSGRPAIEWGDPRVIAELIAFAAEWNRGHPDHDIGIGEISDINGQTVRPHVSHTLGLRVDIRPMRTDGAHAPTRYQAAEYSQDLTRELINGLLALPGVRNILFNDPVMIAEGLTLQHKGHDNHLHVNFTNLRPR